MVRTCLGPDTPTMLCWMETFFFGLNTQVPWTGAIPALPGTCLPFAEEPHPPASRPRLQGLWVLHSTPGAPVGSTHGSAGARTMLGLPGCRSPSPPTHTHVSQHGFGHCRQNLQALGIAKLAPPLSCRPWGRLPLVCRPV